MAEPWAPQAVFLVSFDNSDHCIRAQHGQNPKITPVS